MLHPTNPGAARFPVPDPRGVVTADTLDEAVGLVRAAICPHRLSVLVPPKKSLAYLSSLDLGACGLASLQYGFDVDIDAGCIEDFYLVKWALAGQGHLQCGGRTALTSPGSLLITDPTERTQIRMSAQCHHMTGRVSRRALLASLAGKLRRPPCKAFKFNHKTPRAGVFARAWCERGAPICHIPAPAPAAMASEDVRR